jgi:hypothetical protein
MQHTSVEHTPGDQPAGGSNFKPESQMEVTKLMTVANAER